MLTLNLKIAICEDSAEQAELLRGYIGKVLDKRQIDYQILEFNSGEELIENYDKTIQLIFLDVRMKKMTGIETAKYLRNLGYKDVQIILVTSQYQCAHIGYEINAFRYINKPINYDIFERYMNEVVQKLTEKRILMSVLSKNKQTLFINIEDLIYAEVFLKETILYTKDNQYETIMALGDLEEKLSTYGFFRCHRSYLINLKRVRGYEKYKVLVEDTEVPVSRGKYLKLKKLVTDQLGDILC